MKGKFALLAPFGGAAMKGNRRSRAAVLAPALALALLLLGGCRRDPPAPRPLAAGLLELASHAARAFGLAFDRAATLRTLDRLAERARAGGEGDPARRLRQLLFDELRLERVIDHPPLEAALLPQVLAQRRGSCVGLSALYLALAEALGVPAQGVLVPGHFFVLGPGGRRVELLRRGEELPLDWYRERYRVPAATAGGAYLRPLSAAETLAAFRFNLANEHRLRGELRQAIALYREVIAILPGFAEAQANLGLCHQRLGQRAEAEAAYLRARAASPELPGLRENLEALRRGAPASSRD